MEYDKENQWWIEYTKLSSGQTAVIMFSKYPRGKTLYYFVTFGIADKKKMLRNWLLETGSGDLCTKCTGKCGAEGLIWAYHKLEEFIQDRKLFNKSDKVLRYKVTVCGADARRHRVYRHFLKRIGFNEEYDQELGWIIVKNL